MTKRYRVDLPFTGYVSIEVDAKDEDEAIQNALDSDIDLENDLVEIDYHKRVCKGNVLYAVKNEAEAEEIKSDEYEDSEDD